LLFSQQCIQFSFYFMAGFALFRHRFLAVLQAILCEVNQGLHVDGSISLQHAACLLRVPEIVDHCNVLVPREERRPHVLPPAAINTSVEIIKVIQRPVAVVLLVLQDIPSFFGTAFPPSRQQKYAAYLQHFIESPLKPAN